MAYRQLDTGTLTPGQITANGGISTATVDAVAYTDYAEVEPGGAVLVEFHIPANKRFWARCWWYDSAKNPISQAYYTGPSGETHSSDMLISVDLTAPSNAVYIRLSSTQLTADGFVAVYAGGGSSMTDPTSITYADPGIWVKNWSFGETHEVGETYSQIFYGNGSGNRAASPLMEIPADEFTVSVASGFQVAAIAFDSDGLYIGRDNGYYGFCPWSTATERTVKRPNGAAQWALIVRRGTGSTALLPADIADSCLTITFRGGVVSVADIVTGIGRNLTMDSAGPKGQHEYFAWNIGELSSPLATETQYITISFDLEMTVAQANPFLSVYNTNNKGPLQLVARNSGAPVKALDGETHEVGETISKRYAFNARWVPRSNADKTSNYIEFYSGYDTGNKFTLSNLMVELGDTAHPYRPAPEDLATPSDVVYASDSADVGDVSGMVESDGVIAAINMSGETARISGSRIEVTGDAVFSAINNDTGTTKISGGKIDATSITIGQDQVDGLDDTLTDLIPTDISQLTNDVGYVDATFIPDSIPVANINGQLTADKIDVDSLRAALLQVASLLIGASNGFHIEASGTRMSFKDGSGQEAAYIAVDENGKSTFYMTRSVVVDDMYFGAGKWKWYKRSNNNMSVKWMG